MSKQILYIDMDGVVADFIGTIEQLCPDMLTLPKAQRYDKVNEVCSNNVNVFSILQPIAGAKRCIQQLSDYYDLYFLSTPMWHVPQSYTDKRLWLEKHFGSYAEKRLILSHHKHLNQGHYLVDDSLHHGVDQFQGEHIHFGTEQFPDWHTTAQYLVHKFHQKQGEVTWQ